MFNLPKLEIRHARPEKLKMRATTAALQRFNKDVRLAKAEAGEIEIIGEIGDPFWGGTNAKAVRDALKPYAKQPVIIWMNSPGGDAFEGIAIYNVLREHEAKVTVNVLGLCASAASVAAMGADRIRMGVAAQMMIHSAWGVVAGNQEDMRDFAAFLDGLDDSVAALYAARSGLAKSDVIEMMRKETWMSSEMAVDKGFADSTFDDEKLAKPKGAAGAVAALSLPRASLAASGAKGLPVVRLGSPTPGASGQK